MSRIIIITLAVLVSLLSWQCSSEGNAGTTVERAERTVPVKTAALQLQSFANYLDITGTVKARNHVEIMVEEGGTLTKVIVDKGKRAAQNQALAILENKVLEASFRQAQAALDQAQLDFDSKKVLFEKRAISENEFKNAQYSLDAARAAFELARARFDKLTIRAPMSGLVNNRYYDIGAYANPMSPIFEFIDNEVMKVRAGVAERFLSYLRKGTPVELRFDAYPDLKIDAQISFISQSVDPQNRTFEVEIEIPNKGRRLAPNMVANIRILQESFEDRVVVPLDALVESEKGWHVFIEENSRARQVAVNKVAVYRDQVMVDGLSRGQQLVVVGQQELSDGDSLLIANSPK